MIERVGRLTMLWTIPPVPPGLFTSKWPVYAQGMPHLDLRWGRRRTRSVASIWCNARHGPKDHRLGSIAYETGPLPEYGIVWEATWHTWGPVCGGENSSGPDLASALEAALYSCLLQGFIPSLTAAEAEGALKIAARHSAAWRKERGYNSIRWAYCG